MARRARKAFVEEVPHFLQERGLSLRELGRRAGVDHSFLWRIINERQYKTVNADVARKVAVALDLPEDYFAEYREGMVIERVRQDPELRDRLFDDLS